MPRKPAPETKKRVISCRVKPENIAFLAQLVERLKERGGNWKKREPNLGTVLDKLLDTARSANIEV